MDAEYRIESILVADCGSTTANVALIDLVNGEFRLVAAAQGSSTVEPPWSRIALGVLEALHQIEELTGRELVDSRQQLVFPERENGSGVDGLVATVNAAAPLRTVVVGLIRDLSVESLLRATDSSYVLVQDVVAADDMPGAGGRRPRMEAVLADLLLNMPDAILMSGGVDGGAITPVVEMAKDIAAALSGPVAGGRVHVVFAGNQDARQEIVEALADCSQLHMAGNVRPTLETEDLGPAEEEIEKLYRGYKMGWAPGYAELEDWTLAPVLPTAEGFGLVLRYLAREYRLDVLGVDVGGAATQVAGVIGKRYRSTVNADLGVSYNTVKVLEQAGMERILRWLPLEMEPVEARNRVVNKALRPMTIPQTAEELLLEQAVAREAIALTVRRAATRWLEEGQSPHSTLFPAVDLVVGRGGVLSKAPDPRQAALMLLDGVQPTGICSMVLDKASVMPPLGVLAMVKPSAAAQVVDRDGFLHLGTAISLTGPGREGALALRVKMEYDDGQSIEAEVPYGAIEVLPLSSGERAAVELRPGSAFDVGLGKRGKGATTEVEGGVVGVIIDARGRPLSLPEEERRRRDKIREWMTAVGL